MMSSLLKKVIGPWGQSKDKIQADDHEPSPLVPPTPDLSHLTPDEINVIHDVIRRQEEFERQEASRIKQLQEELEHLHQQGTPEVNKGKDETDPDPCQLCGQPRDDQAQPCDVCQRRVCPHCGSLSTFKRSSEQGESRWLCRLCLAQREVLARTGKWYHGSPQSSFEELKKKVHVASNLDTQQVLDRRRNSDSSQEDDKKLVLLGRQLSGRKRHEKRRHRRKSLSNMAKRVHTYGECQEDSADGSQSDDSLFASSPGTRSTILPTSVNTGGITESSPKKAAFRGSVQSTSDTFQNLTGPRQPLPSQARLSWTTTAQLKHQKEVPLWFTEAEKSLERWRQLGHTGAILTVLYPQSPGHLPGVEVMGGVEKVPEDSTRALISRLAARVQANVKVGQEVLEWNGSVLRGQTFDSVQTITSVASPHIVLMLDPTQEKNQQLVCSSLEPKDTTVSNLSAVQGRRGTLRLLPKTPIEIKQDGGNSKGEIQIKVWYQPNVSELSVTVVRARHLAAANHADHGNPAFVLTRLVPSKNDRPCHRSELQTSSSNPVWNQTFLFNGVTLTELGSKALEVSVWRSNNGGSDLFLGECLLDLAEAQLDNQSHWYNLEEHDENNPPLPGHGHHSHGVKDSNWTQQSSKDSAISSSCLPLDVSSYKLSPSSSGSSNVSPVPFGTPYAPQSDSLSSRVRKKLRKPVKTVSNLAVSDRRENTGSDDSISSDIRRKFSFRSDTSLTGSRSPIIQKAYRNVNSNLDLLAPPGPPSRTSSCSSLFMSDDDDQSEQGSSMQATTPDKPPSDWGRSSSIGPAQIAPRPTAKPNVCGHIKLGFVVTKGQLEVDIICAAGLSYDGHVQPPDTYVKTYLMEGKRVVQSKKTGVFRVSLDPVYHKRVKYSASNVHGRVMKIDVWTRGSHLDRKLCLGEALVRLDVLDLSKATVAWYKLFQMNSVEYGSDDEYP